MNTPIKLGEGSLTMCDINDFRDTLSKEHTVVTLCRFPPKWSMVDKNERHHYYFRAHNDDPKIWSHAVGIVMDAIAEGKDVLLHCVHGRDRTGGVAYAVLRLHGYEHDQAHLAMVDARPSQEAAWAIKIPYRRPLYEKIVEEYLNQQRGRR
jgi:protein-tyrosine phosphatase